jgi:hypothetical protein
MEPIDTLELRKKQADKLVNEIEAELKTASSYRSSVKKIVSEVSTDSKNYKKTINSLNSINRNIHTSIQKFNSEKTKINNLLKQADRFYNKQYLPLKEKIENPNSGFKVKINSHNSLSKKLKSIESECENRYSEVKIVITDFKKKVRELRTINTSIRNLHNSSSENKFETEKSLAEILKIEKKSITLNSNIVKLEKESSTLFKSIEISEKDSKESLIKIKDNLNISDNALKEIQQIYDIAAETGRSGEFENRRNKLKSEVKKWENRVLFSSSVLLLFVVGLFVFQLWLLNWELVDLKLNFYLRFILLSPVIYYLFFCANQHNKAQKLYDKYSFKTTLAMSIKHHIELLVKQDLFIQKGQIEKVLDFVLDAFTKIYNEPYSDDDYKMKIKLANIELDLEKKMIEILKFEK